MTVDEYKRLIKGFLHDEMSAPEFEVRYLSAMKAEQNDLGREAFDILQDVFEDVDAYTHEWPPAQGYYTSFLKTSFEKRLEPLFTHLNNCRHPKLG